MSEAAYNVLVWSFVGQTLAFSIGILLIGRVNKSTALWLIANLLSVVAVVTMRPDVSRLDLSPPIYSIVIWLVLVNFRAWSLSHRNLFSKRNLPGTVLAGLSALATVLVVTFSDSVYRGFLVTIGGMLGVGASQLYLIANRTWRGLPGLRQMQLVYALLWIALAVRLLNVYPIGHDTRFFGPALNQSVSAVVLVCLGLFWQIVYINLILGRQARDRLLAERRTSRIRERSRLLRANIGIIQNLASERLNLLRLMTHEVRQPLNNAQAALHSLMHEASEASMGQGRETAAAQRVQAILDDVILAISNSMIAASIIEWKHNPAMLPIGAVDSLELAVLDCPRDEIARLVIEKPEDEIFIHADPALIRLALRNLLSNALKYSPVASLVQVRIDLDEERQGVTFRFTNEVRNAMMLHGELFARGERGAENMFEGSGLGLFMVSETARLHHGMISCWQAAPDQVTFELLLPA